MSATPRWLIGREDGLGTIDRGLADPERLPSAAVLWSEAGMGLPPVQRRALEAGFAARRVGPPDGPPHSRARSSRRREPRMMTAPPPTLTGRESELEQLAALLAARAQLARLLAEPD